MPPASWPLVDFCLQAHLIFLQLVRLREFRGGFFSAPALQAGQLLATICVLVAHVGCPLSIRRDFLEMASQHMQLPMLLCVLRRSQNPHGAMPIVS